MFVEGMVIPALETLFAARAIPILGTAQTSWRERGGREMTVDALAIGSAHVVAIRIRSRLLLEDVVEYLEELDGFKALFREYADKQIIGAVAGIVIEEAADRFAYRQGLFVLGQVGEMVEILNDETFRPKIW